MWKELGGDQQITPTVTRRKGRSKRRTIVTRIGRARNAHSQIRLLETVTSSLLHNTNDNRLQNNSVEEEAILWKDQIERGGYSYDANLENRTTKVNQK